MIFPFILFFPFSPSLCFFRSPCWRYSLNSTIRYVFFMSFPSSILYPIQLYVRNFFRSLFFSVFQSLLNYMALALLILVVVLLCYLTSNFTIKMKSHNLFAPSGMSLSLPVFFYILLFNLKRLIPLFRLSLTYAIFARAASSSFIIIFSS